MHPLLSQLNASDNQDISWHYDNVIIPKEIEAVTQRYNASDFQQLIEPLREQVTSDGTTGIHYVLLKQAHSSHKVAVAHFNPFGNGMTDNMLLRAAYLHDVFDTVKISDTSLPVFSFASPSANKGIKFQRHHRKAMSRGDFTRIADQYLSVITSWGFKELRVIGFSQGATLAAAVAARATQHGVVVTHLAIGEPANVVKRSRRQLGTDFKVSAGHLNTAIDASGIEHFKRFYAQGSTARYLARLLPQARLTLAVTAGLGKPTLINDLRTVMHRDTKVTLSWGDINTVSPASAMQQIVAQSRADGHAIYTLEVAGGHHTWADTVNVLAAFYSYALVR